MGTKYTEYIYLKKKLRSTINNLIMKKKKKEKKKAEANKHGSVD